MQGRPGPWPESERWSLKGIRKMKLRDVLQVRATVISVEIFLAREALSIDRVSS